MGSAYGSSAMNQFMATMIVYLIAGLVSMIVSGVALIGGAHMAQKKGRSAGKWTALTFFFGLIPFIVLCCLPDLTPKKEQPQPFYTPTPVYVPPVEQPYVPVGNVFNESTVSTVVTEEPAPETYEAPITPQEPSPAPSAPSSYVVACPMCAGKLKVRAEYLGGKVRCPSCRGAVAVTEELLGR